MGLPGFRDNLQSLRFGGVGLRVGDSGFRVQRFRDSQSP